MRNQPREAGWATPLRVPVIAATSNSAPADRARTRAAGIDDLLAEATLVRDRVATACHA